MCDTNLLMVFWCKRVKAGAVLQIPHASSRVTLVLRVVLLHYCIIINILFSRRPVTPLVIDIFLADCELRTIKLNAYCSNPQGLPYPLPPTKSVKLSAGVILKYIFIKSISTRLCTLCVFTCDFAAQQHY